MAFNDIIEKIRGDAAAKAEKILEKARGDQALMLKEAAVKARKEADIMLEQGRLTAEHREQRMKQAADIHARKLLLFARQEVMDEAFSGAEKGLCGLPDREYRTLLKKMVLQAVTSGDEQIAVAGRDVKKLGQKWLSDLNGDLLEKGGKGELTFSTTRLDKAGGFILMRGNININCTFHSLINSYRDTLEPEIAGILFGTSE